MKKVGLLTLPLKDNYGGILQTLALHAYIELLGCEVFLIQKESFYPLWKRILILCLEWVPLQNFKKFRSTRINADRHRAFIDSIISRKTPRVYTRAEMEDIASRYKFDAVVVGSDQVWRMQYIDKIYYGSYFLDFLGAEKTRKIAYAASFGLDHWTAPEKTAEISHLLAEFDAVSSRESSGVELCAGFGRADCEHVLDPTLLIGKDFYQKLIESLPASSRKNLLCYVLDESDFQEQVIADAISILGDEYGEKRIYQKGSSRQHYSIQEWIKAFSDADFVVTDSFHGMVFSIIFNKQFVAISNGGRGASRFESLLGKLNMCSRLISAGADFDMGTLVAHKIDYDVVNAKLDEWRKHSGEFLRHAVLA